MVWGLWVCWVLARCKVLRARYSTIGGIDYIDEAWHSLESSLHNMHMKID